MSADDQKPPLDAALRHLAEQQRRSLTSHPTPQELGAYHAGELPPEAQAQILDHLAICRECSDLLLDLSGFADLKPPAGVPELTDEQVEQDWQALRARMAGEGRPEEGRRPAEVVPIRPAGPPAKPPLSSSPWLRVAASILVVVGLSFAIVQSRRLSEQRQEPKEIIDVQVNTRGEGDTQEKMSSEEGAILPLASPFTGPISMLEIRRDDTMVWSTSVPNKDSIRLIIPGRYLKPGVYEIRLYGDGVGKKDTRDFDLVVE